MNRLFIVAVLTVTMTIMMSTAGYAISEPHNFTCDNCHGKFLGTGTADAKNANNSCIACHSTQGEASGKPIGVDAMSNYFGSATGQPAVGSRSTHTWGAYSAAGHPYNPRAMVHEPTNTTLNSGYSVVLNGTTLCIRCHDVKNIGGSLEVAAPPFLRVSNTNDALCMDCHRSRQATSAAVGTHPVAFKSYSAVYKANTTAFRKKPLAGNIYNKTSNPGNYLSSTNKIVCSTCHAPHNADSSSSTFDTMSTANGSFSDDPAKGLKGQLQNSKGTLLRTDAITNTANEINACSSCHKETANLNHNGKGQNIQCDHCHGAHVDYTGDGSLPNLKLVRRDFSGMSTSAGKLGVNVKVIYNSATSLKFKRADNKGICQICHTPTPGVAIHDLDNTKAADCISCHKHSNGFSAADCTSCHGQPPVTNLVGGPSGKASSTYLLDESLTPHVTHADKAYYNYACKNCHYDGTPQANHNNGSFQSVFVETAGSVGESFRKNTVSDYNAQSRRCSGVYCHSNGSPRVVGLSWKSYSTPSWDKGRNKILGKSSECSTCHESGATLTTNAHYKHVTTNAISCAVCHSATVSNSGAIIDRTLHANGIKNIKFITRPPNYFGVFSSTWNSTTASCNNSCHSNGFGGAPVNTPVWTNSATGACGSCHTASPSTNLHTYHFTSIVGPQLTTAATSCASCHAYTVGGKTHANGQVDLKNTTPCAPCHPGATPTFSVGSKVTCESCHTGIASVVSNLLGNYTAPLKPLNSSKGHGQYALSSQCTNCHNASAPHINAGASEKRLLVAGKFELCNTCHSTASGKGLPVARVDLPVHGGSVNAFTTYTSSSNRTNIAALRADACAGCHDTHGTTNLLSIKTVINGHVVSFTGHTSGANFYVGTPTNGVYNGLCQVCHTKTKYYRNNAAPTGHHTTKCLSCHEHNGVKATFAFKPTAGGCDGCHGYPPVRNLAGMNTITNYSSAKFQDYSGGGGAHSVAGHIPKTARQAQAWTNCTNCHYDQASHNGGSTPVKKAFVNVVVDPKYKFNSMSSIKYNAQTCSNVSCHFKKTPNWTNGL